ncbi:glucose-methanol-choline oxidoreductase [Auricularia subglabra TFB-10046 SS5]|nr:glucose-methanol-choline oxidoreductase [Auricularia subglabra TFB-10046 SS5]
MSPNISTDAQAFSQTKYDFVIIGGGTAGLAIAARLSENSEVIVAVIEAGPNLSNETIVTSGGGWLDCAFKPTHHWPNFKTTPQEHAVSQEVSVPRGKGLGGCSSINAMTWNRASKAEYDALEGLGNPGWTFDSLNGYFNKSQTHIPQKNNIVPTAGTLTAHQGVEGPVKTSHNTWYSSLVLPLLDSVKELGFEVNTDASDGNTIGIHNTVRSMDVDTSTRQSSASTYLAMATGRSNLFVLTNAQAVKILLSGEAEGLTATGVEIDVAGERHIVHAAKQVILSAGAYQSPQLLELSGIGCKAILDEFGIEHKLELPVGENLQDHILLFLNWALTPEAQGA